MTDSTNPKDTEGSRRVNPVLFLNDTVNESAPTRASRKARTTSTGVRMTRYERARLLRLVECCDTNVPDLVNRLIACEARKFGVY